MTAGGMVPPLDHQEQEYRCVRETKATQLASASPNIDISCKAFKFRFRSLIILADAAFEAHAQELLRLYGKFHGQLSKHLFAETIDDQIDGVLG